MFFFSFQRFFFFFFFAFSQLYREESDESDHVGSAASDRGYEWVRLTRLYQFARNVRALLHTYHYNQIFLTEFLGAYNKFAGCSLEPRSYGYICIDELLSAIPQVRMWTLITFGKLLFKKNLTCLPGYSKFLHDRN